MLRAFCRAPTTEPLKESTEQVNGEGILTELLPLFEPSGAPVQGALDPLELHSTG